ncbi:hypothetical protein NSTCB13_07219 [Nostoc sp. DSM 114160]|jgi:hypothetical protein
MIIRLDNSTGKAKIVKFDYPYNGKEIYLNKGLVTKLQKDGKLEKLEDTVYDYRVDVNFIPQTHNIWSFTEYVELEDNSPKDQYSDFEDYLCGHVEQNNDESIPLIKFCEPRCELLLRKENH